MEFNMFNEINRVQPQVADMVQPPIAELMQTCPTLAEFAINLYDRIDSVRRIWINASSNDKIQLMNTHRISIFEIFRDKTAAKSIELLTELPNCEQLNFADFSTFKDFDETCLTTLTKYCPRLETLTLKGCEIGDAFACSLASSENVGFLKHLDLSVNKITFAGAQSIAESKCLRSLNTLNLANNQINGTLTFAYNVTLIS